MLWYDHSNVVEEYTVSKGDPNRADPSQRAAHPVDALAAVQPQRPLDRLRPRRQALRVDGRRRLRQRLGHRPQRDDRQRPGHVDPERQDPAHRRRCAHRQQALRHPRRQPVRRRRRRQARDLGLWPAQPVALLLRHGREHAAVLRRRAAEQLRGGQDRRQGPEHGLAPGRRHDALLRLPRSPTITRRTATSPASPRRSSSTTTAPPSRRAARASR